MLRWFLSLSFCFNLFAAENKAVVKIKNDLLQHFERRRCEERKNVFPHFARSVIFKLPKECNKFLTWDFQKCLFFFKGLRQEVSEVKGVKIKKEAMIVNLAVDLIVFQSIYIKTLDHCYILFSKVGIEKYEKFIVEELETLEKKLYRGKNEQAWSLKEELSDLKHIVLKREICRNGLHRFFDRFVDDIDDYLDDISDLSPEEAVCYTFSVYSLAYLWMSTCQWWDEFEEYVGMSVLKIIVKPKSRVKRLWSSLCKKFK